MHLLLLCVAVFLIMTETARPGDGFPWKRRFEMRGHVLLGMLDPDRVLHAGHTRASLGTLEAGASGTVALKARVAGKFSDAGSRFLLLREGRRTVLMELLGSPRLEPDIGEDVIAVGTVKPLVTWREHAAKRALAVGVFLLAGLLGYALLGTPGMASRNILPPGMASLEEGTVLMFPLFTGLFGLSTLLLSLRDSPSVPEQVVDRVRVGIPAARQLRAVASGCVASIASWFPGISSAISTMISVFLTRPTEKGAEGGADEAETREFIVSVSAVNTSVAMLNLMALFVILKARSGAMKAVEGIMASDLTAWEPVRNVPFALSALLVSALVAGIVSVPLTLYFGRLFARKCSDVDYGLLVKGVSAFLIAMTVLFSGALGLAILAISTCVGMIPPLIGVKRVHLMGCLIVPVMLFFW
jgi:TctA family transporter